MALSSGVILALALSGALGGTYSPGSPGAPWSPAIQKAVKAKLYRIFSPHQSLALYKDLHPEAEEVTDNSITIDAKRQKWESMPNSAKALRLGFHSCLPKVDSDGNIVAGCNGCLNTKGMNVRFEHEEKEEKCWFDTSPASHHNGLGPTLEILEKIYRDPQYPPRTPVLDASLYSQGISRADLWAFATITAVEYGIDMNNIMCEDPTHLSALDTYNYPYDSGTSSNHYHYNIHYGDSDCKIQKQQFVFTTGRSDCIPPPASSGLPPYHTDSEENAPDKQGNGAATVKYFKDNFGMTGQETVALMGSHTLGMFHYQHTVMHYTWTSRGLELFNNDYFRILNTNDAYVYNAYDPKKYGDTLIKPVGDAYGNPAKNRLKARSRMDDDKCGPGFWRHEYLTCQDCHVPAGLVALGQKNDDRSNCDNAPMLGNGTQAYCVPGSERYWFSKDPEVAINAEVGLVLDFEVDEDGFATGCPGLENFNFASIKENSRNAAAFHDCPKQMLAEPPTAKAVSDYVTDYANDRSLWLRDYVAVLGKMLANGYGEQNLAMSPSVNLECATPKIHPLFAKDKIQPLGERCPQWHCLEAGEDTPSSEEGLFLLSQWKDKSNKVLAAGLTGGLELNPANSVCSARQIWRLAGDQILNQMTGQPLRVGGVSSWTVQEHPKTPEMVYIKAAGTKSKKDYLKMGKLGRKYGWRLTRI